MNYATGHSALKQYRNVGTQSSVESADSHRLVQMLMDGALEKISTAKGFMLRGAIAEKGAHISWAIAIIDGLRAALNKEKGGEIAQNLEDLYDYMGRRLLQANVENKTEMLDEVSSLMLEIKSAWEAIPQHAKSGALPAG